METAARTILNHLQRDLIDPKPSQGVIYITPRALTEKHENMTHGQEENKKKHTH